MTRPAEALRARGSPPARDGRTAQRAVRCRSYRRHAGTSPGGGAVAQVRCERVQTRPGRGRRFAALWAAAALCVGALAASAAAGAPADAPAGGRLEVLLPEYRLGSFTRMAQIYPSRIIARGGPVAVLPPAPRPVDDIAFDYRGRRYDLSAWLDAAHVLGLVVLKEGRVAFETYREGTDATTRFVSWSVAKVFTSTLVGLAVEDGLIGSIDDPAVDYLPSLADSAYRDNSVRDLLQMASGVKFVEDYSGAPGPEARAWIESVVENRIRYYDTFAWFDERLRPPGTAFYYASLEPVIAGAVVRRVTGQALADYLSAKVWSRIGAEHDATWMLDRVAGDEIGSCCINATTRDFARFGLLWMNAGRAGGAQVLPADWVRRATRPDPQRPFLHPGALPDRAGLGYQFNWWLVPGDDGAFLAWGVHGQFIYVNPAERVVIAQNANWASADDPAEIARDLAAFRAVEAALGDGEARELEGDRQ